MTGTRLIGVLAGMAVMLAAAPCLGGVTVFLSEVTTIGGGAVLGNPGLTFAVGEPITLGLWVTGPAGLKVNGLGLDIVETAGILSATSFQFMESGLGGSAARWFDGRDPNMNVSSNELFTQGGVFGVESLGLTGWQLWRQSGLDGNFDPDVTADGAFLHAIVEMTVTSSGNTDLFLKVGEKKIGYNPDSDTTVTFGVGDAPSDRTVEGATSTTPDATIHVLGGAGFGDMNGDGNIDNLDSTPFVDAALAKDEAAFLTMYPGAQYWAANAHMDGFIDNLDITPFVALLTGGDADPETVAAGAPEDITTGAPAQLGSVDVTGADWSGVSLGDVNGDGNVDGLDITPFHEAVNAWDEAEFLIPYPTGDYWAADLNGDGNLDYLDITPFIELLTGGGAATVPEPAPMLLLAAAVPVLLRRKSTVRRPPFGI